MKRLVFLLMLLVIMLLGAYLFFYPGGIFQKDTNKKMLSKDIMIKLPSPRLNSEVSLEEAIKGRRSIREYKDDPITLEEISQILWAAQGLTSDSKRTVPSAGALYPLELYIVGGIENQAPGIFHYLVNSHSLERLEQGDFKSKLSDLALGQDYIKEAPLNIVITGVFERTTRKYGERGERYVMLEIGHAGQNIYLQAGALGLGTVSIGAFDDTGVIKLLGLATGEFPFYIFPLGHKK